ncbi:lectin-like protein [Prochlorococcus sp. MIT 0701]|uniref:lectin-like protein n=1 Tax=Prochlorococcus sp. MIT 0701 TaxID=1499502 RepID=UPI000533A855|nr:lectin-like protein [Prochlorococcus sp. MIT 0701]KGG25555.1 hypothetical protein EV12_2128 [Prochlorococcus sp. MIT 0701]
MQPNPPEIVLDSVNTWDELNGGNAYIKGLIDGGKWGNLDPDNNVIVDIEYHFSPAGEWAAVNNKFKELFDVYITDLAPDLNVNNLDLTQAEKDAALSAMSAYSDVGNLRFIENTDPDQFNNPANIQWSIVDDPNDGPGWGWITHPDALLSGLIQINRAYYDETTSQSLEPGGNNYLTYTHEFGHALGLKHPHATGGDGYGTPFPPFPGIENPTDEPTESGEWPPAWTDGGDNGLNATPWSVMTYNNNDANQYAPSLSDTNGYLTGIGAFDIAAIQYLYGPNQSNKTGDDTYSLDLNLNGFQSIWDAAGNDTIDASGATGSVTIDLRNATLENEPGGGGFVSQVDGELKGYTIAYNSTGNAVIENAKGSSFSDSIVGNDYHNAIQGGVGYDTIQGGDGHDTIQGGDNSDIIFGESGNDLIDGQAGFDTAAFSGNIGEYNLSLDGSSGAFQVADSSSLRGGDGTDQLLSSLRGGDGTDQLFNIERINFNGSTYDFPTDITLSASSFDENLAAGTAIVSLSATDPDSGNNHSFSFLSGAGSQDNSFFSISGNQLVINEAADYETKDSYSVRLQAKDTEGLAVAKSFTLGVNDLDDQQTYSLSTSADQVNEGQVLTSIISTSFVDPGTTIYWQLSGNNITEDDLEAGELEGSAQVNDQGRASFTNTLKLDRKTEGNENLQVKIYTDSARSSQVGNTASVAINDTSLDPSYTLSTSASQVNEGQQLTTTITTTEIDPGTTLYWQLSGNNITADDLEAGALEGSAQVDSQGKATFSHTLAEDRKTEGNEDLKVKIFTDSARTVQVANTASVAINDTSLDPTYTLSTSASQVNEGQQLTTTVITTNADPDATLYWRLSGRNITANDLEAGELEGSAQVDSEGKIIISQTFAEDHGTEGDETVKLKVFSDPARSNQVAESSNILINDTSTSIPLNTYKHHWTKLLDDHEATSLSSVATDRYGNVFITGTVDGSSFIRKYSSEGTQQWNNLFEITNASKETNAVTVAEDGNIHIAGTIRAGDDTDYKIEYEGETVKHVVRLGFISTHTSDGDLIWSKLINNTGEVGYISAPKDIHVDREDSIYVTGDFFVLGGNNSFISKYDSDGAFDWINLIGNDWAYDITSSLATDSDGQVYVSGTTTSSVLDGQNNHGVAADVFISSYTKDGDRSWTTLIGSAENEYGSVSVSVGFDDSLYVTGSTAGDMYGEQNNHSGIWSSKEDVFISKLTSEGHREWTRLLGGSPPDYGGQIDTYKDGSVVSAGSSWSFGDGMDVYISKIRSDGTGDFDSYNSELINGNYISTSASNTFSGAMSASRTQNTADMAIYEDGSIYLIGATEGNFNGETYSDDGKGYTGNQDFYLTKYSYEAGFEVTTSTTQTEEDQSFTISIESLDANSNSKVYWNLSGENIDIDDFAAGELDGDWTAQGNSSINLSYTLNNDQKTEGNEEIKFNLFSDEQRTELAAYPVSIEIVDTSKTPTYALTSSSTIIEEGKRLTTHVSTTNIDPGTELFWSLDGNNITKADLSEGNLEGSILIGALGKANFTHEFANDRKTELNENLEIKLFTDSLRDNQVGETLEIEIIDTSLTPTYSLFSSKESLQEGELLTSTINTTNLPSGTPIYWSLVGEAGDDITESDVNSGQLKGTEYLDSQGQATISHVIANDRESEGAERLRVKIFSDYQRTDEVAQSASIIIQDTSKSPAYSLTTTTTHLEEGDVVTTRVNTNYVDPGTELYWQISGNNIDQSDFSSGQLTGSGTVELTNNIETPDLAAEFSFSHTLAEDLKTEDLETFQIRLFSDPQRTQEVVEPRAIEVVDTSKEPLYQLTTSSKAIDEGDVLTTTVSTTYVEEGTELHWSLTGANINQDDLSDGQIQGSGQVDSEGKFIFSHTLAKDAKTEGDETLGIKLFTDAAHNQPVAGTTWAGIVADVQIRDTSQPPTYELTTSSSSIEEGQVLTTNVSTGFVEPGTELHWSVSGTGINQGDFEEGALTGSSQTDSEGKFSFSHTLRNDQTREGPESLDVKLFTDALRTEQVGNTATVEIKDTSMSTNYVRRGDSAYVIVDGPSWQEAEANAQSIGGNLVTINDAAKNQWLTENLSLKKWIGFSDYKVEGDWQWADRSGSTYTNWSGTNPDNSTASDPNGQDYGYIGESGLWDDGENPNWPGIAELQGIAEISLARSNPNITQSWEPPLAKQWTRLLGASYVSDQYLATGSDGSIYIAGDANFSLDGQTNSGSEDVFLTKYDPDGTKHWTQFLGPSDIQAYALETGSDGSIYIAGYSTVDLDGQTNSGSSDSLLIKYDSDGTKDWTQLLGTSSYEHAHAVTTFSDGSIYIAGITGGDLDGKPHSGRGDAFLTKYDPDGTKDWTNLLGSTSYDDARALTTGSDGSIYVAATLDFLPYLTKYNPDGTEVWTDTLSPNKNSSGNALTTGSDGSIYIAGSIYDDSNAYTIPPYSNLIGVKRYAFLDKYDPDGNKDWTQLLGTVSNNEANALTTGSDGSIYIAGYTLGNLDEKPYSGSRDAFLTKYDPDGNKEWTHLLGTASSDEATALTTGSDGSIYIAGYTAGNLDGQINNGSKDAFLSKYAPAYSLTPDSDLELSYSLHSINGTDTQTDLKQLAVLGDSVDWQDTYRLDITAKSLAAGYDLETADITINFDPFLFNEIKASDITIGGQLPIANAVRIDNDVGTIRIAAASLGDLVPGDLYGNHLADAGASIGADGGVLASIDLNFNEFRLDTLTQNSNGKILDPSTPLFFGLSANQDETVFSKDLTDASGLSNREIKSLRDLGGDLAVEGTKVTLYEATINLEEQGDGLILSSDLDIGSYNSKQTNLVRAGDTITATSEWTNVGNIQAKDIQITGLTNANASLTSSGFYISSPDDSQTSTDLESGSFVDGAFVQAGQETAQLVADIEITGAAGNVVDLSQGILSLQATGSDIFKNQKGSKNLITFQGDLNYDGRVSMKDLAYLNAGAARQQQASEDPDSVDANGDGFVDASVARGVDANFDGQISMADLAVLDADWGESLHQVAETSTDAFLGESEISWEQLDNQGTTGDTTWDNQAFKDQNAVEAGTDFVESLESSGTTGVIGGDGNSDSSDNDIAGDYFQDPLST